LEGVTKRISSGSTVYGTDSDSAEYPVFAMTDAVPDPGIVGVPVSLAVDDRFIPTGTLVDE
jgi:hypothetical protein